MLAVQYWTLPKRLKDSERLVFDPRLISTSTSIAYIGIFATVSR